MQKTKYSPEEKAAISQPENRQYSGCFEIADQRTMNPRNMFIRVMARMGHMLVIEEKKEIWLKG